VRWTEKRNFEAILNAIATGQLDVNPLITDRVPLEKYLEVYGDMRKTGSIASILIYSDKPDSSPHVKLDSRSGNPGQGVIGIIGAGNFTSATLLPQLSKTGAHIKYLADLQGVQAKTLAKRYHISNAVTDYKILLNDPDVDTVMIITRHNAHARLAIEALQSGKNVFVEKPLALNQADLQQIIASVKGNNQPPMVVVGFNRRFAPLAKKMKQLIGEGPKNIVATMNAGYIPPEVWVHDMEVGGGRIIGEACHYIDLCTYIAGSRVKAVCMNSMGINPKENTDNASILLKYENGTNAVINYFANGNKAYSKERVEVYSQEKTLIMDNWRTLQGFGVKGFSKMKTRLDKGHKEQFSMFVESIKTGKPIIPLDEIVNTTKASFCGHTEFKREPLD
jgi:predicted dehydrogenase